MKKTTKPTLIDERFWRGSQSAEYRAIYEIVGSKVCIEIKRDSYDPQSYARCAVYSAVDAKWNPLCGIPYPQMVTVAAKICHVTDDARIRPRLLADVEVLLDLAKKILG